MYLIYWEDTGRKVYAHYLEIWSKYQKYQSLKLRLKFEAWWYGGGQNFYIPIFFKGM